MAECGGLLNHLGLLRFNRFNRLQLGSNHLSRANVLPFGCDCSSLCSPSPVKDKPPVCFFCACVNRPANLLSYDELVGFAAAAPEVVWVLWLRNCLHLWAPVGHGRVTVESRSWFSRFFVYLALSPAVTGLLRPSCPSAVFWFVVSVLLRDDVLVDECLSITQRRGRYDETKGLQVAQPFLMLRPNGPGYIYQDGSVGMKIAWYCGKGVRGKLKIHGKRLDAPAPPLRSLLSGEVMQLLPPYWAG